MYQRIILHCPIVFILILNMALNISPNENVSLDLLTDYPNFYIEYYYTIPPENGEYFYIGQEGRTEPDEVIQITLRFVNNGKYPIANGNMVITENDIVFCTAEDFGKTQPGKYTEFGFAAMGTMGSDTRKYFDEKKGRGVKRIHVVADFDVVNLDENLNVTEVMDHLTRELEFDIPIGFRDISDYSAEVSIVDVSKKESQQFTVVERLETDSEADSDNAESPFSGTCLTLGTIVLFLLIGAGTIYIIRKQKKNE